MVAKKSVTKAKTVTKAVKPVENEKATKKVTVTKKTVTKKVQKKTISRKVVQNVIYIGHLPKHCEERELIGFLKQFGILTQLRLCRSEKTGGSKGYAFAKFQDPEVAKIVADTLNGYLLMQKRLISHVLAPEQIHQKLFASKTRTVFQRKSNKHDGPKSLEKMEEISRRLLEREVQKKEKLKAMGIDYDYPGYSGSGDATTNNEKEASDDENEKEEAPVDVEASDSVEKKSAKKKRKHSIDETLKSPEPTKEKPEHSQSEKKKKKKKKDKKRRKSAP